MWFMNDRVPICRQIQYIIVANIMFMTAYMLRMLLVLVYMLRLMPVSMIMIALHNMLLIVLVVLPNMLMLMNMRAMSAYAFANANVWNF